MFVKKCKAIPKSNLKCNKLKWTKCPVVGNFLQNATERLLQTSKEY